MQIRLALPDFAGCMFSVKGTQMCRSNTVLHLSEDVKSCMLCRCGAQWYQFDDARVTLVPEQYVRLSNAYMLFYLQQ